MALEVNRTGGEACPLYTAGMKPRQPFKYMVIGCFVLLLKTPRSRHTETRYPRLRVAFLDYVSPIIGNVRLNELEPRHVLHLLDEMERQRRARSAGKTLCDRCL